MIKLFSVVKYELLRYLLSPLAYIYLITFLLLNGSFAIYFGGFFERNTANLIPMFAYQPWLYLLFIPGISMRLWAEEFRSKTIVQIITLPVSITTLVWGKFLASLLFCALALTLTFPFWLTVNWLGDPDNGVIALSYFASLMLAACMLALSQTMSALTKNQVVALVLAVILNLLFFLSGLEYVLAAFRLFAPAPIVDMVASFSFLSHFEIITQGLLELRDILFFASLILLFNLTTVLIISFKTSGTSKLFKSSSKSYYILAFFILLIGFIGLNLTANNWLRGVQFDATEDQSFSLTHRTKEILQNLPEPVTAKLYYSKELEKRNPGIRTYFDRLRLVLREFSKASNGRFKYQIYNPTLLDKNEDIAYAEGLQPIPLIQEGQNVFFGMVIADDVDRKTTIPFFPLTREQYLEYDLIEKIYTLYHHKKTVGILTSIPLFETQMTESYVTSEWEILNQIRKFYQIKEIKKPEDIGNIDVLMLIHPEDLSKPMLEAIEDYSLAGGNSLLLLDVASEAPRIYSPYNRDFKPSSTNELETFFGFRFYKDAVLADLDNSILVDATDNYRSNPTFVQDIFQFILTGNNFNKDAKETKNLQNILFASASVIQKNSNKTNFIPLIAAGPNSGLMYADMVYKQAHPSYALSVFEKDNYPKTIAAKIINKDPSRRFEAIVVADTDFAYDTFWAKTQSVLDNQYLIPLFDNANFILNALETLSEDQGLADIRGKSQKSRPFNEVEKLRKASSQEFKVKENIIFNKIEETKKKLGQIINKKTFEQRQTFTADELSLLSNLRYELDLLRKDLADIKAKQDLSIQKIDLYIKLINIYAVPLLLLIILSLSAWLKRSKLPAPGPKLSLNKEIKLLALAATALLLLGLASAYLSGAQDADLLKDQPVFKNLSSNINEVETIELKNNKGELVLYKQNGLWLAKNHPYAIVNQERVRDFLSSLLRAVYFEKKSSKAEHLSKFGLQPIEVEGSENLAISLRTAQGQPVESFELGKYDLDIGRGSRAAYIKFGQEFQVWQIEADFFNLSTRWQNWSYSTLWDLNFGRLIKINNIEDPKELANLAKLILNTPFISAADRTDKTLELGKLEILSEGGSKTNIFLYKSGSRYYIKYQFMDTPNAPDLQFFATQYKNYLYEISSNDYERLSHALPFN